MKEKKMKMMKVEKMARLLKLSALCDRQVARTTDDCDGDLAIFLHQVREPGVDYRLWSLDIPGLGLRMGGYTPTEAFKNLMREILSDEDDYATICEVDGCEARIGRSLSFCTRHITEQSEPTRPFLEAFEQGVYIGACVRCSRIIRQVTATRGAIEPRRVVMRLCPKCGPRLDTEIDFHAANVAKALSEPQARPEHTKEPPVAKPAPEA